MSRKKAEDLEQVQQPAVQPESPVTQRQPVQDAQPQQAVQPQPQPQQVPPQQPMPPQQPPYYDPNLQYGQQPQYRPIYIDPNAAYNAPPRQPVKTKKTGSMVCGIIFTILAIIMLAVTAYEYFGVFMLAEGLESAAGIAVFFAFMLVYGWFTYIPALAFAITGVCCSAAGTKSSSKGQKATSIVFLVFSIMTLVTLGLMFLLAFLIVGTPV